MLHHNISVTIPVMIIGFSISQKGLKRPDAAALLEGMLSAGCRAIQLHIDHNLDLDYPHHTDLIKRFEYITIHLPYLKEEAYDDPELNKALRQLAGEVKAQNFTFHPVKVASFSWLADEFGDQVCAENMDWLKDFGQTPDDLNKVFADLPGAGWTFDVNHILTNDPSLKLAERLYQAFAHRLRQYHLSGFVDKNLPHTLLADTKQDEIINLVKDHSKPIILESLGAVNLERFQEELDYVTARL